MTLGLRIQPGAEADLREAAQAYEDQRPGLRDEFLLENERCLALIQDNPQLFTEIHKGVRRALLKRFPYGVFYVLEPETVVVLAVLHLARNPELWP